MWPSSHCSSLTEGFHDKVAFGPSYGYISGGACSEGGPHQQLIHCVSAGSVSQAGRQSVRQSVTQSGRQSVTQSGRQSVSHSVSHSGSQAVSHSVRQAGSQAGRQSRYVACSLYSHRLGEPCAATSSGCL